MNSPATPARQARSCAFAEGKEARKNAGKRLSAAELARLTAEVAAAVRLRPLRPPVLRVP